MSRIVDRQQFDAMMRSARCDPEELHALADFDRAREAAVAVLAAFPGIGLLSPLRRMNAFYAACHHLDRLVQEAAITEDEAQAVVLILRMSDGRFRKAVDTFDAYAGRIRAREAAEMGATARSYLVNLHSVRR
jgi:hypothetical protein